jgi:PKD repeat protein
MRNSKALLIVLFLWVASAAKAQITEDSLGQKRSFYTTVRDSISFEIFQFPRDRIPRIDGKTDDWAMVPDRYIYGSDLLNDTEDGQGVPDPADLDVRVKVGWVKGLSRLYFLYEAYDDFWDFARYNPQGYQNDIFEIVVDGDLSGGPFIYNPLVPEARQWGNGEAHISNHFSFSGVHAQNYHIYTPPVHNAWCLVWGSQPWVAEFPQSNYAYDYNFSQGDSGRLVLEFWVTPYDYAPYRGVADAVPTALEENQQIGLSWSVLDFDGGKRNGHYNLAHNVKMVYDASYLPAFRLMPLEKEFVDDLRAEWSFQVVDANRRLVAFRDETVGEVTQWKWDFGDGTTSEEQHPVHQYREPGVHYNVTLEVLGPAGSSKRTRFWEVMVR